MEVDRHGLGETVMAQERQILGYDPETGKAVYAGETPALPDVLQKRKGYNPIEQQIGGALGAAKSVATVPIQGARFINWLTSLPTGTGMSDAINPGALDRALAALQPTTASQRLGKAGADVGMSILAGGPATIAARGAQTAALKAGLARPAAAVVRGAVDAATSAAVAGSQGQDMALPAVTGGLMGSALGVIDDAARAGQGVENRLVKALAPTGRAKPNRMAQENIRQVAPALARELGVGGLSRGSVLAKVSQELDAAGDAMDTAAAQVSKTTGYDTNQIWKGLQRLRNQVRARGVATQPGRDEALEAMQAQVKALGPTAPYSALAKLRRGWQKTAAESGLFSRDAANQTAKDTGKAMGDGASILVETLAKGEPAMQAANARWSFLKKAKDAMELAEQIDQTNPRALRGALARSGGAIAGGGATGSVVGAGLGAFVGHAIEKALGSGATTQIVTARALARLEDAMKSGAWADVETALTSLRLAAQSGAGLALGHGTSR